MKKRLLSLILAIAMLTSLLPTLSFAADVKATDPAGTLEYLPGASCSNSNFALTAWSSGNQPKLSRTSDYLYVRGIRADRISKLDYTSTSGYAQYVAVRMTIENPGEYYISFKEASTDEITKKTSTAPGIYFFKASDTDTVTHEDNKQAVARATFIGTEAPLAYFNFYTAPNGEYEYVKCDDGEKLVVSVEEAGDYYVALSCLPESFKRSKYVYDGTEVAAVEISDSTKTSSYSQRFSLGGIKFTPVNSSAPATFESVTLSHDKDYIYVSSVDGEKLALSAKDTAGNDMSLEGATIVYTSSDESVAKVSQDGVVTPVAVGDVKITASVTIDGVTKTAELALSICELKSFTVDFSAPTSDLTKLTPSSKTKPRYYINAGDEVYGENWKVLTSAEESSVLANDKKVQLYDKDYIVATINPEDVSSGNNTLAFEINVPESGRYDIVAFGRNSGEGGNVDIYVDDTWYSKGELYASGSDDDKAGAKIQLDVANGVELTAGAHTIAFENSLFDTTAAKASNSLFSVTFTPSAPVLSLDSVSLNADATNISVTDTDGVKLSLSAKDTDGNDMSLEGATIVYTSSDESVAKVSQDGVVTPVAVGDVKITASVTIDGVTKTAELALNVCELKAFTADFSAPTSDVTKLTPSNAEKRRYYINAGDEVYGENWKVLTTAKESSILATKKKVQIYDAQYIVAAVNADDISAKNDTLSFEITVPVGGKYDIVANGRNSGEGGYVEIFVNGVSQCKDELFASDAAGDTAGSTKQIEVAKEIELKAGANKVSFKNSFFDKDGTRVTNSLYSMTFIPVTGFNSVALSSDVSEISLADTDGVKLSVSAKDIEDKEVSLDEATIVYSTSDANIATVSQDGVVIPVAAGEVEISVSVTIGEITRKATRSFKIYDPDKAYKFVVDFRKVDRTPLVDGRYFNRTITVEGPNWKGINDKNISTILGANNRVSFYNNSYMMVYISPTDLENGRDSVVFEFTVPKDGIYDIMGHFKTTTAGGYANIYIGDTAGDYQQLSTVDCYSAEGEDKEVLLSAEPVELKAGTHRLKFTGTMSSGSRADVLVYDLMFTEAGFFETLNLSYDEKYILLEDTAGKKLTLSAFYDGGRPVDLENDAQVVFETSDRKIATVTEDGTVIPVAEGEVTITAKVTVGETTKEATLPLIISVEPITGFELDFTKVNRDKLDSDGKVNRGGVAEGPNWKLNTNKNTSTLFGANGRVKFYESYLQLFFYNSDITNNRTRMVVDFEVEEDGIYDMEIFGGINSSSGIGEFYIDDKYIDEYDFWSEINDTQGARATFRQLSLTAGTHRLTIVARRSLASAAYVILSKIKFNKSEKVSPIVEVGVETARKSIAVGESEPYLIYALQENGVHFYSKPAINKGTSDVNLKLESLASDIVAVDGDYLRAVKSGDAEMKISGEVAGVAVPEGKFTINVNENVYDHAEIDVVYDLFYEGGETEISASAYLSDGTKLNDRDVTYSFTSDNTDVATISGNKMKTIKEGEANITAHVTFNGVEKTATQKIKVVTVALEKIEAYTEDNIVSAMDADGSQILVKGTNNDGSEADVSSAVYSFENLSPDLIEVSEDGRVYSLARGGAEVKVVATIGGLSFECIAEVISSSQKTEPTLYTYEMRENALYNISKYDWAKKSQKTAIKDAEYWLENLEAVYDSIMYEGIPRTMALGLHDSPDDFDYKCAYCQEDVRNHATAYGWKTNPLTRPFKIQCPACKRYFPSNDFESFYKLGLDQKRQFNRTRALEAHRAMLLEKGETLPELEISEERRTAIDAGLALTKEERAYYGYGKGYLKNTVYRDAVKDGVMILDHVRDANGDVVKEGILLAEEDLDTYAVDDGMGWDTGLKADSGIPLMKTFIPFYHHAMYSINGKVYLSIAIPALMDAYLYTGDIKYGRAGAILIDRIADVFPSFDLNQWVEYQNSHGGKNNGKILGSIWSCGGTETFVKAYDAFYPAMDDPYVINFLSEKAAEYGLENPKLTGDMIRENCENGILREAFKAIKEDKIAGNFGMHQMVAVCTAVALDTFPETQEMLDWLMANSGRSKTTVSHYGTYVDGVYKPRSFSQYTTNTGGEIGVYLINEVDRDGFGYEVGAGYNSSWGTNISDLAEVLYRYEKYEGEDLYEHPKLKKMFNTIYQMTMAGGYTLQLGDDERTASTKNKTPKSTTLRAFKRLGDPIYARILYDALGGTLTDTYIDIFEPDAEAPKREIEAIVEEQGPYKLGSRNLPGFGFTVLSGGELIKNSGAVANADFRRDTWLWYGNSTKSHGHEDLLQMGIDAYGFNFTPDLGYPKETGSDPNRNQWVSATISHNTVVVDGKAQNTTEYALPYHYDGEGLVKLIDVDAPHVYEPTDIYRRTLVSVDVSDEVAYTVDFFRILGGNDHTYSFHTQSADGYTVEGLNLVPQKDDTGRYIGSYAGPDVPYGEDPGGNRPNNKYPLGYTWLKNVNRDEAPASGNFSVNFKQTDFKHLVNDSKGLNLKFTALNDWTPSGVGIAAGLPPHREENLVIPHLDYMLIHRKGSDLDTLFTSVIQPYKGEEYIESMESVSLTCNGTEGETDASRAVKVKLKTGRTDYIIYATNNGLTYTLTDGDVSFDFSGFVGVYSINDEGRNIYTYINDGTKIADIETMSRYTGKVKSFTEELSSENEIVVTLDQELSDEEIAALAGEYVYIDSDKVDNASYRIEGANRVDGGISLDIGDVTLIRSYRSVSDFNAGYRYNIAADRGLYIPLSVEDTKKPVINAQRDLIATAGSVISVPVLAKSVDDEKVIYIGTVLPRGASIDSETGIITWKPTSSQIGENGFFVTVRDESGRENSITFVVTVYGSTSGGTSDTGTGDSGNAGGGAATPTVPDAGNKEENEGSETPVAPEKPSTGNEGESSSARFVDLGAHVWAADAINALANDGIIRGTSEATFSPANNITRADFAILLVRAFKLESENAENFADVNANDYFAKELAIARNTGIVGGIGDNKYAPKNNITRQDMMVIVYRALKSLNIDLGEVKEPQNADFANVSDYARDAVSALISAGLVNGKGDRIAPNDFTTRAEVAVLIKRILDFTK